MDRDLIKSEPIPPRTTLLEATAPKISRCLIFEDRWARLWRTKSHAAARSEPPAIRLGSSPKGDISSSIRFNKTRSGVKRLATARMTIIPTPSMSTRARIR